MSLKCRPPKRTMSSVSRIGMEESSQMPDARCQKNFWLPVSGYWLLEGNIVVGDRRGILHRILVAAVAAIHLPIAATAAAVAAAEQHDLVGLHFRRVVLLAVLFPLPRLQAAFEIDLLALYEIGLQRVRRLAPQDDAMPLGLFLLLAFLRRPVLGGGHAEARHRLTAWRHA